MVELFHFLLERLPFSEYAYHHFSGAGVSPHTAGSTLVSSGFAGAPHSLGSTLSVFAGAPHSLGSAHLLSFYTSHGEQLLSVLLEMFKNRSPPNTQHNQGLIHQNELLATQ